MIFDTLLQLPVFQGLSKEQLTVIFEKTPFLFRKYREGDVIVNPGDPCDRLIFVLSGTVNQQMPTFNDRVSIVQDFEAPHTMPFYYLFGVQTLSPSCVAAKDEVGVMELDKPHFLQLLQTHEIPLVNVLNMLSTHAQKQHASMNFAGHADSLGRLASWLLAYTEHRATNIKITACEEDWCMMLNMQPVEFWRNVAVLEGRNIVESESGTLKLIDRYALRGIVGSI